MSSDPTYVFSPKTPHGTMLVVRGDSSKELTDALAELTPEVLEELLAFEARLASGSSTAAAVGHVQSQIPAQVVQTSTQPPAQAWQAPQGAPVPPSGAAGAPIRDKFFEQDGFGEYFAGVPGAPTLPDGIVAYKYEGRTRAGKPWREWRHPAETLGYQGPRVPWQTVKGYRIPIWD